MPSVIHPKVILAIGHPDDEHIISVTSHLQRAGYNAFCIEQDAPVELETSSYIDSAYTLHDVKLRTRCGRNINADEVCSVWWRVKRSVDLGPIPKELLPEGNEDAGEPDEDDLFLQREHEEWLEGLPSLFPNAYWPNTPSRHRYATNKILQLKTAAARGWRIPDTLVSNDPAAVAAFVDSGPTIYKTLKNPIYSWNRLIMTTEIDPSTVAENYDAIRTGAGLFQRMVNKKYELRVMIAGDSIKCLKIDSQKSSLTSLDWRHNQFDRSLFSPYVLSQEHVERLKSVMSELGIAFGVADLIRNSDDELVFLEINPGGQWLWLDEIANFGGTEAMASLLMR